MNKRLSTIAAALLLLGISGCAGPAATQTGGGPSSGGATPTATTKPSAAAVPGTTEDAVAAGWLAGTATPSIPEVSTGKVDVVVSGPIAPNPGGTLIPFALRNGTGDAISSIDVTGAATDATGKILASGQSQGLSPATVQPGGVALGFVYFDPNTDIPADSKVEFTVASRPLKGEPYFRDLKVEQANAVGDSITGKATNPSKDTLNGPYSVHATCFDEAGALLSSHGGFASPSADLAEGQSVMFQVSLYGKPCPSFLLGVSGYGPL